jgi:alcohol dehydrogenase (NADP+)
MHWPVADTTLGHKIEYLDTWTAMTELVLKSKTRHIGVSNFSPAQLETLLNHTSHPPAVHQMELHPYLQQRDWLAWHEAHGIHVTGYSPFAGTNPTYTPGEPPQLLKNEVIATIAEKRNCTPAQVALAWGMHRGTSVIPKSSHHKWISENYAALECELTDADFARVDELAEYHHRFNNPSKSWDVDLYDGLEDSHGKHRDHE